MSTKPQPAMKLQPVRGTHDVLPAESPARRYLESALAGVATRYGFGEISTPMFEFSEVFHRTLGDTSDVVTKETYTFEDRGGESLTLRPEFTAAVVRAFISNGLQEKLPFKAYYCGPAFRYERPQKGRLRQFHQFGAELLGDDSPIADIETIAMAHQMLTRLGLAPHVTLEINSLGDKPSRDAYRSALVSYLSGHEASLSDDSKLRLHKNPLRILDSKDEGDKKIVAGAPAAADYFTPEASDFFSHVRESLTALNIAYTVNPRLVRGLDYYQHTVFEFTTTQLGAQGTVLAGGRYDGLVALMGGPDVAGVGFAAGIERLIALTEATCGQTPGFTAPAAPVAVLPYDDAQLHAALLLTQQLRGQNIPAELFTRGNMGKKMKRAEGAGCQFAFILGPDEVAAGNVAFKDMKERTQQVIPESEALSAIRPYFIKDIA